MARVKFISIPSVKWFPFRLPLQMTFPLAQHIVCSQADYVLVRARMVPGAPQWDDVTERSIVPALSERSSLFEQTYIDRTASPVSIASSGQKISLANKHC